MGILVDILLLLIFICFILIGKKKGFVRTLLLVVSKFISVLLARFVSTEFSVRIYDVCFKKLAVNKIESYLESSSVADFSQNVSDFFSSIPDYYLKIANILGFDELKLRQEINSLDVNKEMAAYLEENIIGPILSIICSAVVFVVVYVLSSIVFSIIIKFVCKFFNLPILKTVDGVFGAFLGSLNGIICVFIVSYLLVIAYGVFANESFRQIVDSSYLINLLTKISF